MMREITDSAEAANIALAQGAREVGRGVPAKLRELEISIDEAREVLIELLEKVPEEERLLRGIGFAWRLMNKEKLPGTGEELDSVPHDSPERQRELISILFNSEEEASR